MVGLDRVSDGRVDAEDEQQLAADDGVGSLDIVVHRLADVVEGARLPGRALVRPSSAASTPQR